LLHQGGLNPWTIPNQFDTLIPKRDSMANLAKTHPCLKALLIVVLLLVLYASRMIVIASLIGVGIGVLISPALDRMQSWLKLKRGYGALLFLLGIAILTATVLTFSGWVIVDQVNALTEGLPGFSVKLRASLERVFDKFPWMLQQVKDFDFAGAAQTTLQYFLLGSKTTFIAISGVVLALIIGIYLAVDADSYFNGTVRAFPPKHRDRARDVLKKCSHVVRVWFRAQLIDMAIIGLITTLGLWIVGVKYWALFGLLTAILGIIPYVGVMIVVVIVSLITLATDASQVPWVLLVFFITQQIEGNLVLPMVMKGQVEIPEALLIVAMLFFGSWFGLLGVFIAPSSVAVLICLYRELYIPAIEDSGF
jgi:predicted PurR-regulated permease PerM